MPSNNPKPKATLPGAQTAQAPQEDPQIASLIAQLAPQEPDPPSKAARILSGLGDIFEGVGTASGRIQRKPSNFTQRLQETFREDTQRAADRSERVGMLRLQQILGAENREDQQRFQEELAGQAQEAQADVQQASIKAQKDIATQRDLTTREVAKQNNDTRLAIARLNASVDQLRATNNPAELARVTGVYGALGQDLFATSKTVGTDIKQFARDNDVDEASVLPEMRREFELLLNTQRLPEQMATDMLGLWDLTVGRAGERYLTKQEEEVVAKKERLVKRRAGEERFASSVMEDLLRGLQVPTLGRR